MEPILSLKELYFQYDGLWAIKDVSFDVRRGEILGILGPNGSGKTTLLKLMCGILSPNKGDILLQGRYVREFRREELSRMISMVSQQTHFRFPFSVLEVVLMGRFPHLGRFQFEGKRDVEIALSAMKWTNTIEFANRNINELSGGERQRVLIALALAQEPEILLLDEPTSFLDLKYRVEIFQLISELNRARDITVIISSHDLDLASCYCERLIMLKQGSILHTGTPTEVINEENIQEVYGCPVLVDTNPATGTPRVNIIKKG